MKHAPDATDQAAGPAPVPHRLLGVWWRAVRPFSFTASVTPVLVGSAVAYHDGLFDLVRFGVTLVASVAIHAATNLINDYYDHLRGVDTAESIGPSGVIQQGLLAPRAVLLGGLTLFALGGLLGLWLVAVVGWPILAIGAASVLAGYAYTGGPLPLGYIGLGDLTVFLFMGVVIVVGAYYVQAGTVSAAAVWASLPIAALVAAILVVNNLRDIEDDRAKGKRTLATFIGRRGARLEYLLLLLLAYASVALGVALRVLPAPTLIVLLTLPRALANWRVIRESTDALTLTRGGVRETARLHQRLGVLLAIAFLIP
ncbi:MAG: 1,4-dihydroxy-2-naphthoateoctaprenyltransferase, 1,4-dihydroxy-2-naphthoate octaprenyltransferase [Armatimonadetes bacterium CSP1-3]|nr:MAG: 1,4-dihydroxy-2-naphthoateoctaprenyltransferase, 1,4-dihydroxy-2-naphthoate octaprenyltransferase [Armatimonadetes bacterium CSP1-3]